MFLTRKELCIVMEYADCGDMHDYMHRRGLLAEKNARWFFQQLIIAMDYCHKRVLPSMCFTRLEIVKLALLYDLQLVY